jgi:ArsR family metal-binding transcriptional regulator
VAKVRLKRLRKYMQVAGSHLEGRDMDEAHWSDEVRYEPVFKLGVNMNDSLRKLSQVEELCRKFPGLDCGSCGAPSCKALAEDIVRGVAKEEDCIHILRDYIHKLSDELSRIDVKKG